MTRIASRLRMLALALAGMLGASSASGDFLTFVPVTQTVVLGQQAVVQVAISGTSGFAAPSIGGYDLTVAFDGSILAAAGVTFESFLGNPLSLPYFDISAPDSVNFAEVSLLSPAELDALQPDWFLLALLSFDTLSVGVSPLSFIGLLVSDAFGLPVVVDGGTASITVIAVSEPGTLALVGIAVTLLGLGRVRRAPRP